MDFIADNKYRQQALDVSKSFIVQAPAGSGKTTLLINRYLKLLAIANVPENVLVMTFTNKAVAELKQRLYLILSQVANNNESVIDNYHTKQTYQLAKEVLLRSEELSWHILDNPERLKITTIDGLSKNIVAMSKNTTINTNIQQKQAYYQSAEEVLKLINDAEYNTDIIALLHHLDNNCVKFCQLIATMLAKRDQWLRYTNIGITKATDSNKLRQILITTSNNIINQHLKDTITALNEENLNFLQQLIAISPKLSIDSKKKLLNASDITINDIDYFIELKKLLLTQNGDIRVNILGFTKAKFANEMQLIADKKPILQQSKFRQLLQEVEILPDNFLNDEDSQIISSLTKVLNLASAQLILKFKQQQALDFIDIAMDAVYILNNEDNISEFSLYLDNKIAHILVDEFQDTSYTQFELLKALTKLWQQDSGRTIFLVGDPMQSIYKFRQAEVGLFLQVWQHGIAEINLYTITLSSNFRSSYNLVNANNKLFSSIFPKHNSQILAAISYSPSITNNKNDNANALKFFSYKNDNTGINEAQRVIKIISTEQQKNPQLEIAILVRSRVHLSIIIKLMQQENISFIAPNFIKLGNNIYARDILSLIKAITNLGDKLSWLSILRAPWCGLLLQDLLLVSSSEYLTVWQALNADELLVKLSLDGKNRVTSFCTILEPILAKKSVFNFRELLELALLRLGFDSYANYDENNIKNTILDTIDELSDNGVLDIELLVNQLNNSFIDSSNITGATKPVQIMTIYSAKGLEFDIVIMPGLGKTSRRDSKDILLLQEFSNGLLLAPIKNTSSKDDSKTYKYLIELRKKQNYYELMRVLYVAMTRAKTKLYLLANINKDKPNKDSLLYYLWKVYKDKFIEPDNTKNQATIKQQQIQLYRLDKLNNFSKTSKQTTEVVNLSTSLANNYSAIIGTVLHYYLQQEIFQPSYNGVISLLTTTGIASYDIANTATHIIELLTKVKKSKHHKWLFKKRSSTMVEASFYQKNKPKNINIILDRVFIDNDIVWIIDYKTSTPQVNEKLANFLLRQKQEHQQQMRLYKQVLTNFYSQNIKIALYLLTVDELLEIV